MPKKITNLLITVALTGMANSSNAQFQGHHAKGGWGLQSGTQVPEGFFFSPQFTRFDSDTIRDANGNQVNRQGSLGVSALTAKVGW